MEEGERPVKAANGREGTGSWPSRGAGGVGGRSVTQLRTRAAEWSPRL